MAKKGGNVFRNPVDESATKVATLPDLTAYQAKWGTEGRPSPKTQGIDAEGNPFQKYGTQQLSYVDPTQPALGVVERDVGKNFQALTTKIASPFIGIPSTTKFSQQFQSGVTGAYKGNREEAIEMQNQKLKNMGIDPDFGKIPDLGDIFNFNFGNGNGNGNGTGGCVEDDLGCGFREFFEGVPAGTYCKCPNIFGWDDLDKHGCECDACKSGTGQCSDKCGKCDAWDIGCEAGCATEGIIDDCGFLGISCMLGDWWDKYGIYVMIVAGLIGIGVLLYLLKPLFNMIGAIKGGGKNA